VRNFAALCLCLAACKSAPPPAAPPPPGSEAKVYYPLAVGNSWTYAVTGSPEKATIEIVGRDGEWFLDDHRGRLRYDSDGVRDADRYLLRTPVKAGARWSSVENLVVQRFEIISDDTSIVTLGGTFTHCVVVRTVSTVKKDLTFVTEWTFAPRVGIAQIVTSTLDASGNSAEQTRLSLAAFHVAQ
jgi:hypothetical protein